MASPRAIGIVRVSRSAGRSGESFSSPRDQADLIRALATREGWDLEIPEPYEIDVSGDALLVDRPQLSRAVVAVQTGTAEIIVGAHTERLWWNHETASQVIRLVEDANGEVWSADQGLLTCRSAADEFSGTVRTAADRLSRRQNAEKSAAAIQRAINRGVPPWPRVPAGYRRRENGTYEPDPTLAPVVQRAFEMRARSHPALVREVRAYLAANGITLTYPGTVKFLKSTVVLGEIRYGRFTPNLHAHEAIVNRETWARVQEARVPKGRMAKSERLLARLGVLRCGTCDSRMVASTAIGATSARGGGGRTYVIYRCQDQDCGHRVTISAPSVERDVWALAKKQHADLAGRGSVADELLAAERSLAAVQASLDTTIRAFATLEGEASAVEVLREIQARRDAERDRVDRLRRLTAARGAGDPDTWALAQRRDLIRNVLARVVVLPGRGDRLRFEFRD